MSGLIELFTAQRPTMKLAQAAYATSDGAYQVYIDGEMFKAYPATNDSINPGAQILVNTVETKKYIIGVTRDFNASTLREVIIRG